MGGTVAEIEKQQAEIRQWHERAQLAAITQTPEGKLEVELLGLKAYRHSHSVESLPDGHPDGWLKQELDKQIAAKEETLANVRQLAIKTTRRGELEAEGKTQEAFKNQLIEEKAKLVAEYDAKVEQAATRVLEINTELNKIDDEITQLGIEIEAKVSNPMDVDQKDKQEGIHSVGTTTKSDSVGDRMNSCAPMWFLMQKFNRPQPRAERQSPTRSRTENSDPLWLVMQKHKRPQEETPEPSGGASNSKVPRGRPQNLGDAGAANEQSLPAASLPSAPAAAPASIPSGPAQEASDSRI